MKRGYADIIEGQIHYQIEGNGKPLLLLHQGAFSSDEFLKVIPILGKNYQVIARDMLGYGKSDPNPPGYEIEDYARADINFLNALGIRKTSIVGSHTGASIAVEMAVVSPEVVDKLVLYGAPSFTPDVREACIKSHTFSPVEIKEDGSHFTRLWRTIQEMGRRANPEDRNMVVVACAMASGGAFHAEHACFRYNEEARMPLVKNHTLLISGTEGVFYNQFEVVKNLLSHCQTKAIEGVGDYAFLERPEELAQAVLYFLNNPEV